MKNSSWNIQHRKNTKVLAFWTTAWTLSVALATFGPKFIWQENVTLTVLAIMINVALGIGMILANIRHLKGLDEMQQKIQLEAMGIALGVGVVSGINYTLLDATNIIPGDAEISILVMLMALSYLGAIFIGLNRYK